MIFILAMDSSQSPHWPTLTRNCSEYYMLRFLILSFHIFIYSATKLPPGFLLSPSPMCKALFIIGIFISTLHYLHWYWRIGAMLRLTVTPLPPLATAITIKVLLTLHISADDFLLILYWAFRRTFSVYIANKALLAYVLLASIGQAATSLLSFHTIPPPFLTSR